MKLVVRDLTIRPRAKAHSTLGLLVTPYALVRNAGWRTSRCSLGRSLDGLSSNRQAKLELAGSVGVERELRLELAGNAHVEFDLEVILRSRRNRARQFLHPRAAFRSSGFLRTDDSNGSVRAIEQLEDDSQCFALANLTQIDKGGQRCQSRTAGD